MRARLTGTALDPAEVLGLSRRLLPGPTWDRWRLVLRCILGDTANFTAGERALVAECTGNRPLPTSPVREAWLICGRRSGKTTFSALMAVASACFSPYRRSRGERPVVLCIAENKVQAGVEFDCIAGMFESPALAQEVVRRTADTLDLRNGVRIAVHACSYRSSRGVTALQFNNDEIAFWADDSGRNPSREVIVSERPALLTTNGLMISTSSPYSRTGALYAAFERYFGKPGPVFVWKASSLTMHPGLDAQRIADARAEDPVAAASEWDAEWRTDISALIDPSSLAAVTATGVKERPPVKGVSYVAFCDPSGGRQDSMTLGISHADGDRAVLDCVREIIPPFDPKAAVAEFAALLAQYRVSRVTGDAYSGAWVESAFEGHSIRYVTSDKNKSALYLELLPLINSGRVSLLDMPRLRSQLLGLERRTGRSGRDSVDHGPSGHDDVSNAAAGALVLTKISLGRAALPDTFTTCLKAAVVPSFSLSSCYLSGGNYYPTDPICQQCPGHQSAKAMYARFIQDGGDVDIRTWAHDNITLPAAMQWAEVRAMARNHPYL